MVVSRSVEITMLRPRLIGAFCNTYQLQHLNGFKIERNEPQISDHKPIVAEIFIDGEKSIDTILKVAKELNNTYSNHSRIPAIYKFPMSGKFNQN